MRNLSLMKNFVRYAESECIIAKVQNDTSNFYDFKVSTRKPFGLATDTLPLESGDLLLKYNKGIGAYDSSLISKGKSMIPQWKVIISRLTAEHAGQTDSEGRKRILSSLYILKPYEICTETYLVVDAFDTQEEAQNLVAYLKTRLVRFLIAQLAATQQMTKDKFQYVPFQNFTESSDIDWKKSISEIDQQLYTKYHLTDEEIAFIEKMIKPM